MTATRWNLILGLTIASGALAWLVKFAVIVATEGEHTVSGAPGFLWDLGLLLLAGGAVGIALQMTHQRPRAARVVAVLLAPAVFFLSFLALDFLVKQLIPFRWPVYLHEEAGVMVVAVIWLVIGLMILAFSRRFTTNTL